MKINELKNIESEAGIIATIINNPEFTFYSEQLKPNHFTDNQNAYIYYAISELAKKGVEQIDAYNITNILNSKDSTKKQTEILTIQSLNELIEVSSIIARKSVEEYKLIVNNVLDKAFRRDTYKKLEECKSLCFVEDEKEIQQKIYDTLDNVMMEFSTTTEIPQYKTVVKELWNNIKKKQKDGSCGTLFKYPTLNNYATIDKGELVIFAADTKVGKSVLLLNCAVDLMKKDVPVLYIDSELPSETFTIRLLAHLSGIEYKRIKTGNYSDEEERYIEQIISWLETRKFTHLYLPFFDAQTIYTSVKKTKHTQGLEVLIVDYFKSKREGDAFSTYQEMGKLIDMVKNQICGDMDIAGIGAVQATSTGKIADSANISRSASTIVLLERKTSDEIDRDGAECGNSKLRVVLNRNGEQQPVEDYIDLHFNGNLISYEEAKQHIKMEPY